MVLISVIIPAYNAELFIEAAIDSVLNQTLSSEKIEIIVVNDGSVDNTFAILNKYIVRKEIVYLEHEGAVNKGVSKTRMLGIRKAQGQYVAFLDADDIFKKDKLEKQLTILNENPSVVLTHSKAEFINETNDSAFMNEFKLHDADKKYKLNELPSWLKYSPICNSSILVRKDFLFKIQFEFPQAFQHEDWLLLTLLSAYGDFYYCNEILVSYRYHEKSATAGLIKNNLLIYYARMEYLLTLYLASPEDFSKTIAYELKQTLVNLAGLYAVDDKESEIKKNKLLKEIFGLDDHIMNEMIQLQKENVILKRTFLNRAAGKIKSFFKR